MKKALLIFALVAFLATGTVFAELTGVGEPTVSGSVSTTYGYDLDSEAHGFYNDSSLTLTLPLLDGDMTKGGDDGMYGEITVDGIGWQLNNDGFYDVDEDDDALNTSELDASINAKLVLNSMYIDLGAPDFDINYVDVSDDYIVDANFWADDEPALMGIAVGFMNDMVTLEAKIANRNDGFYDDTDDDTELDDDHATGFENDMSDGDDDNYTANNRGYILGAMLTATPMAGVSFPVSFSIDMTEADTFMALGAAPSIEMDLFTLDLPMDYVQIGDASGFEVAPSLTYALTEKDGSNVAFNFLYGTYTDVSVNYSYDATFDDVTVVDAVTETGTVVNAIADIGVVFTETEENGFVPGLAAMVDFHLTDMMDYLDAGDDMGWTVDAEASYNMNGLKPYVGAGYADDEVLDMNVGVEMAAAFTGLDNTVLTLDYANDALTENADGTSETESGRVTFDATVSF